MAKQDNLDPQTRDLVRFAAAIAQGYEPELRERVGPLRASQVPAAWVEELLLQSVLMVGYPRALVAFTVWRKFSGARRARDRRGTGLRPRPRMDPAGRRGLRHGVRRQLPQAARERARAASGHRRVDDHRGLRPHAGRPGLDLLRRELCTVAQTAVLEAPRQLHSHLRGALNAGATFGQIEACSRS